MTGVQTCALPIFVAEISTDDQRVGGVIELLENLTEKYRKRESRDQLPRTSLSHIPRRTAHSASLLLQKNSGAQTARRLIAYQTSAAIARAAAEKWAKTL